MTAHSDRPDHDPSWRYDRRLFCAALRRYGGYGAIAVRLEAAHLPRPSTQPPGYRTAILSALASGRDLVEAARADMLGAVDAESELLAEARLMGAL